jgi:hypothetical protein
VAEGVEHEDQLDALRELGVDRAGLLPVPAARSRGGAKQELARHQAVLAREPDAAGKRAREARRSPPARSWPSTPRQLRSFAFRARPLL